MLHLEAYAKLPLENDEYYVGGSFIGLATPPIDLINPTPMLEEILQNEDFSRLGKSSILGNCVIHYVSIHLI